MSKPVFMGYSAQELDAQYNNQARVPDHGVHFHRWEADSQIARQEYEFKEDISYGSGDRETLDVFPSDEQGAPVVVFIHGGYWQALSKTSFSFVAPSLVRRGFTVVIVNYPLCPVARMRDIVHSVRWSMVYLHRHIHNYNGDASRMYLVGHSAGGHLAAMMMATDWSRLDSSLGSSLLSGGVSISGIFQLEPLRQTFLNRVLNLESSEIEQLSPVDLLPRTRGKLDLRVGDMESTEYLRQSRLLTDRWATEDLLTDFESLAGHNHFSILTELTDSDGSILKDIVLQVDS